MRKYLLTPYLGSTYGRRIFRWIALYYRPAMYVLIGLAVISGLADLYFWRRHRHR
ncbi:MAG TPA: hypothetical protein VKG65_11760 [Terriglobales bacterium]|nr:hypothetical protein [Terriglobales bacterium]